MQVADVHSVYCRMGTNVQSDACIDKQHSSYSLSPQQQGAPEAGTAGKAARAMAISAAERAVSAV